MARKPPAPEKPLPADTEAEQSVLGSFLLDRDLILFYADYDPARFSLERHRWIFEAMISCYKRRTPPDIVNVADELQRRDRLDAIGGRDYLAELVNATPTATHIDYYAAIVTRTALNRQLIDLGGKIARLGYQEEREPEQLLADATAMLAAIGSRHDGRLLSGDEVYSQAYSSYVEPERHAGPTLCSGLSMVDRYLGRGMELGEADVVAGRTGTGKSTFLQHLRLQALLQGFQVLECSAEMKARKLADRQISAFTGVPLWKFRSYWNDGERQSCIEAAEQLGSLSADSWQLWDVAQPLESIKRQATKLSVQCPKPLVVIIDHIGLLPWPDGARDETRAIQQLMPRVKAMAMELNAIVLVAAQMNRSIEGRDDDSPRLSDLYGSDRIAQDSDRVLFVWLNKSDRDARRRAIDERQQGVSVTMRVMFEKNRDGNTGTAAVRWLMDCYRLEG